MKKVGNPKLEKFAILVWKMNLVKKSKRFYAGLYYGHYAVVTGEGYYGHYAVVTVESYGDEIEINYFQKK